MFGGEHDVFHACGLARLTTDASKFVGLNSGRVVVNRGGNLAPVGHFGLVLARDQLSRCP